MLISTDCLISILMQGRGKKGVKEIEGVPIERVCREKWDNDGLPDQSVRVNHNKYRCTKCSECSRCQCACDGLQASEKVMWTKSEWDLYWNLILQMRRKNGGLGTEIGIEAKNKLGRGAREKASLHSNLNEEAIEFGGRSVGDMVEEEETDDEKEVEGIISRGHLIELFQLQEVELRNRNDRSAYKKALKKIVKASAEALLYHHRKGDNVSKKRKRSDADINELQEEEVKKLVTETAEEILEVKIKESSYAKLKTWANIAKGLDKTNIQRRIIQAMMIDFSNNNNKLELNNLLADTGFEFSRRMYRRARKDLESISEGFLLINERRRTQRYKTDDLKILISFILDNVSLGTWNVKRVALNADADVLLPNLQANMSYEEFWRLYVQEFGNLINDEVVTPFSRTKVLEIIKQITTSHPKTAKSAIDYNISILLHDTINALKRMIEDVLPKAVYKEKIKEIYRKMDVVSTYLKYTFPSEVSKSSKEKSFRIEHALFNNFLSEDEYELLVNDNVMAQSPFILLQHIEDVLSEVADAQAIFTRRFGDTVTDEHDKEKHINEIKEEIKSWDDCLMKSAESFKLLLATKVRGANVKLAHEEMWTKVKVEIQKQCEEPSTNPFRVVVEVIFDHKMKLQEMKYNESTIDFYGKWGFSLLGFMVTFFIYDKDTKKVNEHVLYYYVVSNNDSKQNAWQVLSLIEAFNKQLQSDIENNNFKEFKLPEQFDAKEPINAYFMSDNAPCFANAEINSQLPIICALYNINLVQILKSEVQQGKTRLDSSFGVMSQALIRFVCNRGSQSASWDICDTSQLVAALDYIYRDSKSVTIMQVNVSRTREFEVKKKLEKNIFNVVKEKLPRSVVSQMHFAIGDESTSELMFEPSLKYLREYKNKLESIKEKNGRLTWNDAIEQLPSIKIMGRQYPGLGKYTAEVIIDKGFEKISKEIKVKKKDLDKEKPKRGKDFWVQCTGENCQQWVVLSYKDALELWKEPNFANFTCNEFGVNIN